MTTTTPTPIVESTEAAPAAAAPVRTLAIVSLALGAAAIVSGFNLLLGVPAIIVGVLALQREPAGRSLAIAGIVTGSIAASGLVLGAIAAAFAIPFGLFALPFIW